jgi:hypothetical protein
MYRKGMTSPQDLNGNSEALPWNLMGKWMGHLKKMFLTRKI